MIGVVHSDRYGVVIGLIGMYIYIECVADCSVNKAGNDKISLRANREFPMTTAWSIVEHLSYEL